MTPLSAREMEIMRLAITETNREVAYRLGISEQTVKNHLSAAYRKLDVISVGQAAAALGWLVLPDATPAERHDAVTEAVAHLEAARDLLVVAG